MKGFAVLSVILIFQKYAALHFKDQFGLNITYNVTFDSKCRNDEGRFRKMLGIGLSDCVRECGLRPHCEALSYMGRMQMCDLFSTTDEGNLLNGECMYISGSDIKFEKTRCGICLYGQVCDMPSKQCKYKECIPTRINNGIVLGNLNEVGSKIRYKCKHGYRYKNGIVGAVCKEDGTWNVTANCTRVCNDLPTVHNGTVSLDKMNGNFFMDTATVTCHTGYQKSVGTITCTASGDWENAACDPLDCGDPVSPANGTIVSNSGTMFLDTATVTCDDGYKSSVDGISCTASGQWDTVTCDRISCGDPPSIANGNITLNTGTLYMDTASITCDMSYKASSSTITCTASGTWEMAACMDCYVGRSWNYAGQKNVTVSGNRCQRWDAQSYFIDMNKFPESDLSKAENYCRNPDNWWGGPWCFTDVSTYKWEECGISEC